MPELGRGIAAVLRGGTLLSVAGVVIGLGLAIVAGGAGPGPTPVLDMLRHGGGDALTGAGLLALTLTPPASLVVAAVALARAGERTRALTAAVVLVLILASLVAAVVIGASS